ncbi:MAG: hypothetical protein MMC23_000110 [Stictis urceolatum]|nr:hypothetical protein [Stictis urceolata]
MAANSTAAGPPFNPTVKRSGTDAPIPVDTPPTYEQSIHSTHSNHSQNYFSPDTLSKRTTQPDLPIPVSRRSTIPDLPIPVEYERSQHDYEAPIPVQEISREDYPIPVHTPPPDAPPLSRATSSTRPASTSSANKKKKKKSILHPFGSKDRDPSKWPKSDPNNPYLHAKPAVPVPAAQTIQPFQAEQAYSDGFRDAQAGVPAKTPWGLLGEHYARGYQVAAEGRQGLAAQSGQPTRWGHGAPLSHAPPPSDSKPHHSQSNSKHSAGPVSPPIGHSHSPANGGLGVPPGPPSAGLVSPQTTGYTTGPVSPQTTGVSAMSGQTAGGARREGGFNFRDEDGAIRGSGVARSGGFGVDAGGNGTGWRG